MKLQVMCEDGSGRALPTVILGEVVAGMGAGRLDRLSEVVGGLLGAFFCSELFLFLYPYVVWEFLVCF